MSDPVTPQRSGVLSTRFRGVLSLLLLATAVLAAYASTLHSPFVLDDESNIVNNRALHIKDLSLPSLKNIFFSEFNTMPQRPVANLTFALNYLAGGDDPAGYHLVNLLIHLLTAIGVYRLYVWYLRRTNREGSSYPEGLALLAALVWALNPIQTSAVTYVVQRMTSLCSLFVLASLLLYLRARELSAAQPEGGGRKKALLFAASFALWLLAMLTKEIAAIMPLLLVLHELFFFDRFSVEKIRGNKYFYLAILLLAVIALMVILGSGFGQTMFAGYAQRDFTLSERVLTEFRVVLRYFSLFLLPLPGRLTLFYDDYQVSRSLLDPASTTLSLFAVSAMVAGACLAARKYPLPAFGILWTLLCLLLESSVLPLELVFEHRFYLPSVGFALALVVGISLLGRNLLQRRGIFVLFWTVLLAGLVFLTAQRNADWRSRTALYLDGVRKSPRSVRALVGLGVSYAREGQTAQAVEVLERALAVNPDNAQVLATLFVLLSEPPGNQQGETKLRQLKRSIQGGFVRCSEANSLSTVAEYLVRQQRYRDAILVLEGLTPCTSVQTSIYFDNLGLCYFQLGEHQKAAEHFQAAHRLNPHDPYILFSLAVASLKAGDPDGASRALIELRKIRVPDDLQFQVKGLAETLALP